MSDHLEANTYQDLLYRCQRPDIQYILFQLLDCSATHFPYVSLPPNEGPILGRLCRVSTAIPLASNPGDTYLVCFISSYSLRLTHIPPEPFTSTIPLPIRQFTTIASCPVASMTNLISTATGSTQVITLGSAPPR